MPVAKQFAVMLASVMAVGAAAGSLVATASAKSSPPPTVKTKAVNISPNCTNGVYSGYCGTEQNVGDGLGFYFRGSSDWIALPYQGGTQYYVFEYAPNGVASNNCITESGKRVNLSRCTGAKTQLFTPAQQTAGFTWQNVKFGYYLQSNGKGAPLTGAVGDGAADQEWNFTTS